MEHDGTVSEATWGSFDPSVPVEDSEVMAQLFGPDFYSNEAEQKTAMFWPTHDSNSNFDSSNLNNNLSSNYWSTQLNVGPSSNASGNSFFYSGGPSYNEGYYLSDPNAMPLINEDQMVNSSLQIGLGNNFEKPMISLNEEPSGKENVNKDETSTVFSKRKSRAAIPASKRAKNSKSKKAQKSIEEEANGENSSYSGSDDDSNESPDINEENISSRSKKSGSNNQNGKSRANRGSATDPQSLYARKRRERINERLKILQNLVPNGTKVDISTMLEEAVQYVKFLQLQIKLLSSDDLWMYAPIAYNGMNIGLDLRIAPPQ